MRSWRRSGGFPHNAVVRTMLLRFLWLYNRSDSEMWWLYHWTRAHPLIATTWGLVLSSSCILCQMLSSWSVVFPKHLGYSGTRSHHYPRLTRNIICTPENKGISPENVWLEDDPFPQNGTIVRDIRSISEGVPPPKNRSWGFSSGCRLGSLPGGGLGFSSM